MQFLAISVSDQGENWSNGGRGKCQLEDEKNYKILKKKITEKNEKI